MAKTKNCKFCKKELEVEKGIMVKMSFFCSFDHAAKHGIKLSTDSKKRQLAKKEKADKSAHKKRKKETMKMSEWFDKLQKLVNQYVLHVLEKNAPCRTCGTTNNIKYDAGHFRSRGSCSELRFELTNIHKQCSVQCNGFKSGARAEYNKFIISHYGQEHYDWLVGPHKPLKEQLPHWSDVEKEIIRYRKLLRGNGLTPNA